MRFTIRDVLWLTVVIALVVVIARDRWKAKTMPLALDGYCPVTLTHSRAWQIGDPQHQTIHDGQRYLFVSAKEQEIFTALPERYAPVCRGNDPVQLVEERRESRGQRHYGLVYHSRIYLFDSEATMHVFEKCPRPVFAAVGRM